jgi:hypothetical protein
MVDFYRGGKPLSVQQVASPASSHRAAAQTLGQAGSIATDIGKNINRVKAKKDAGKVVIKKDAQGIPIAPDLPNTANPIGRNYNEEYSAIVRQTYLAGTDIAIQEKTSELAEKFRYDLAGHDKAAAKQTKAFVRAAPDEQKAQIGLIAQTGFANSRSTIAKNIYKRDFKKAEGETQAGVDLATRMGSSNAYDQNLDGVNSQRERLTTLYKSAQQVLGWTQDTVNDGLLLYEESVISGRMEGQIDEDVKTDNIERGYQRVKMFRDSKPQKGYEEFHAKLAKTLKTRLDNAVSIEKSERAIKSQEAADLTQKKILAGDITNIAGLAPYAEALGPEAWGPQKKFVEDITNGDAKAIHAEHKRIWGEKSQAWKQADKDLAKAQLNEKMNFAKNSLTMPWTELRDRLWKVGLDPTLFEKKVDDDNFNGIIKSAAFGVNMQRFQNVSNRSGFVNLHSSFLGIPYSREYTLKDEADSLKIAAYKIDEIMKRAEIEAKKVNEDPRYVPNMELIFEPSLKGAEPTHGLTKWQAMKKAVLTAAPFDVRAEYLNVGKSEQILSSARVTDMRVNDRLDPGPPPETPESPYVKTGVYMDDYPTHFGVATKFVHSDGLQIAPGLSPVDVDEIGMTGTLTPRQKAIVGDYVQSTGHKGRYVNSEEYLLTVVSEMTETSPEFIESEYNTLVERYKAIDPNYELSKKDFIANFLKVNHTSKGR